MADAASSAASVSGPDRPRRVAVHDAGAPATGCPHAEEVTPPAAAKAIRDQGSGRRVSTVLVGRVGWLELALIGGLALAPIVVTLAVALWVRLTRSAGAE